VGGSRQPGLDGESRKQQARRAVGFLEAIRTNMCDKRRVNGHENAGLSWTNRDALKSLLLNQ
jgi:hypothetical protein